MVSTVDGLGVTCPLSCEGGADPRTIQLLLGHRDLEQTARYPQLSARHLSAAASPLDCLQLTSPAEKDPGRQ